MFVVERSHCYNASVIYMFLKELSAMLEGISIIGPNTISHTEISVLGALNWEYQAPITLYERLALILPFCQNPQYVPRERN